MKHLVIGLGEIGKALYNVLSSKYSVNGIDVNQVTVGPFDFIHICFPYSELFVDYVKKYKEQYASENCLVIIHSTVPVGTSASCQAVHSPVRGIHPKLEDGILTFKKYLGGNNAAIAAEVFANLNIVTEITEKSETTEALKLWETTIYAWNILIEKEIYKYCEEKGLDFSLVYSDSNKTYNEGYEKLGRPEYKKFVLKHVPGKIGGHCLIPNAKLLKGRIADLILEHNEEF